jgi:hypothetical protein
MNCIIPQLAVLDIGASLTERGAPSQGTSPEAEEGRAVPGS